MLKIKEFLGNDFLLSNEQAENLYFRYAATQPIIDFHNHLPVADIANNKKFSSITELWLEGDHYKWRAMRANGIPEKYCTGSATPKEKFKKWAETVPYTLRNPLYHWTHLELKNYFGIDKLLNESTADTIYEEVNALLRTDQYSVKGLLQKMNVEVLCTTDDPTDTLEHHKEINQHAGLKVYPTFRPDKVLQFHLNQNHFQYLQKLSITANIEINSVQQLCLALEKRMQYFNTMGCRLSDHGLDYLPFSPVNDAEAESIFSKVLSKKIISRAESDQLCTYVLQFLSSAYARLGWTQQFHLGAMRNNNVRMLESLGADTGFDSIGDYPQASSMAMFLAESDRKQLGKTILYNLNPSQNEVFASMLGNFNDGTFPGKIQWGSAWWFLDQKDGMTKQINTLSNMGLLSRFVGMVTDSRSFLSFPRHEYFRRILCNTLGEEIEKGELPDDMATIGKLVSDVCYYNAKKYLGFNV
jgi:glucuronate isomerase